LYGGFTSVVTQPYEGFLAGGVSGLLFGVGRGIIGTVAKPAAGILDLATETANAVRDRSRNENRLMPLRLRPPRVVRGPHATLPRYSITQALGQEYLHLLNEKDMTEVFIAFEKLRTGSEDMAVLVSSRSARLLTRAGVKAAYTVVVEFRMRCVPVTSHFLNSTSRSLIIVQVS
jgi:vacuolar protein sorting-associated protein 13D